MNTKHTPGPWHYEHRQGPGYEQLDVVTVTTNIPVAETFVNGHGPFEECEANARLIAAAPDLLAALRVIKAAYSKLDAAAIEFGVGDNNYKHVIGVVEQAIAKAERGEE